MKKLLLLFSLTLLFTSPALSQSKFAGEYMGVLTTSNTNEPERYLVNLYAYPDGGCFVNIWSYDFVWGNFGAGTITRSGRFEMLITANDGTPDFVLKGVLTSTGNGTGACTTITVANGKKVRWTASFKRRFQKAYDLNGE